MKQRVFEVTQGCTLCGTCLTECPTGAISLGKRGAVINADMCAGCGACYDNCASEAIVEKKEDERV